MVRSIQVSLTSKQMRKMDMVSSFGLTVVSMKGSGRTTRPGVSGDLSWLMEMSIREIGLRIRPMGMESTITLREPPIRAAGSKTNRKAMARNSGLTTHTTKESIYEAKSTDRVPFSGLMGPNTPGSGVTTKCMGKASLSGRTAESIKANISTIRSMVRALTSGPTAGCMWVVLATENSMARVFTPK